MKLGYLALDLPDPAFVAKDCARVMGKLTARHQQPLRRAAHCTFSTPALVWRWEHQKPPFFVTSKGTVMGLDVRSGDAQVRTPPSFLEGTWSDSRARYSWHLLCHRLKQSSMVQSSSPPQFLVQPTFPGLHRDLSAARGILARKGTGNIRHLEISDPTCPEGGWGADRFAMVCVPGKTAQIKKWCEVAFLIST